jgi:hypothetical protein
MTSNRDHERAAWPGAAVRGVVAAVAVLAMAACGGQAGTDTAASALAAEYRSVHVDSVFPIDEEVRRFRATLADSAATLSGGASSRDELVARFTDALAAGDRARLAGLALTAAEFAYLYYPYTRFTRRPYELGPGLVWFQLENYGSKGLNRAIDRYGGRPLRVVGHECGVLEQEGPNRVWNECVVRHVRASGDTARASLFGAILERDGQYKFISYGNRL